MRTKDAAFLALLQGNQLDLVVLVEIQTSGDPLRYAIDDQPRTWNGATFTPTSGTFGELQVSAERQVPALQMLLQNADGVLGQIAFAPLQLGGGLGRPPSTQLGLGEDLRGRRVTIRQAARSMLDSGTPDDVVIEWTLFIEAYRWVSREAVVFNLGVFPVEAVKIPDRTLQGLRCRWVTRYKGSHCGSVSSYATCNGTIADCRLRFPGEPLRFGGFPTAADARALRLA